MLALIYHYPIPILYLKKLGCDISTYRDILADPAIKGATRRRRSAVVGLEYGLEQGQASDRVMKLCEQTLANLSLRSIIRELHDAAWFGYSPAEIYWQKQQGLWLPQKVVGKPPEWFDFNAENELCFREVGNIIGEPVPDMKFILARNDASYANPYGVADMAAVYWHAVFRKGGLKFWLRFADKYGQAFVIGKHPCGTPQNEVSLILDSLEALSQSGVGAIPNDGSVEILESAGKGATADMFERLLKYCRSEINIALLGQDQSTDSSSTNASAHAGIEVTEDIRDADGEMIAEAINALLRYVVRLNVGDDEAVPVWSMWEETDVTEALANRDMNLQKAGARLTKQYFMRAYGLGDDEVEVDAPLSAQARVRGRETRQRADGQDGQQVSGQRVDFSEVQVLPQDYASLNTQRLANDSQPVIDDWLLRIKSVIDNAVSLESLPDLLANEFSELPTDKLVQVIEMGLMASNLAGQAEVLAETNDEQA